MAGHSKWSNIKHKKGAADAKRGKVFSRLARQIRTAVKEAGSADPETNLNLRPLLDKAKQANMPNDNIQRALDAGMGKGQNGPVKEIIYEGFGSQGIGLLIVALTDNKNRTSSQLRNVLNKAGGSLGAPGSVTYMFTRGEEADYVCSFPLEIPDESKQQKLQALIDELREQEDVEDVFCAAKGIE